jgi:hypothetical protein
LSRSLRCEMPGDVLLLLKGSPEMMDAARARGPPFHLTLTRWTDAILPTNQYRCFVINRKLIRKFNNKVIPLCPFPDLLFMIAIVICQRDITAGFHNLAQQRDSIISNVYDFFRNVIAHNFPLQSCKNKEELQLNDVNGNFQL